MGFLELGQFGLLAAAPALGLGDLHALAGPRARDQLARTLNMSRDRVRGGMDGSAGNQSHVCKLFDDFAGGGEGTAEPVEFRDDCL